MGTSAVTWQQVVVIGLGVVQTCGLAYIASRSRRVRRGDNDAAATTEDPPAS